MKRDRIPRADSDALDAALRILMRLRRRVPHRGAAWKILDAACQQIDERFWRAAGRMRRLR